MNSFIDKVFVISLVKRQDRRSFIVQHFGENGIEFQFWDAVENENGVLGLLQSMKSLFQYCLVRGYENVSVFEDDCNFLFPVKPFLETVIPQLPKDYHCFYLGQNLILKPTRISENILRISGAYSTHSIIYSRAAMEIILPLLDRDPIPYDILLFQSIQQLGKSYCTFPMVASQRSGYSNIDGCEREWGVLMSVTYSMQTKNLVMEEQPIPCKNEHLWGGKRMVELLDPMKYEPQHTELWGKVCDCGNLKIFGESTSGCACDGSLRWEFQTGQSV